MTLRELFHAVPEEAKDLPITFQLSFWRTAEGYPVYLHVYEINGFSLELDTVALHVTQRTTTLPL